MAQCWCFNRLDGPLLGVNKHLINAGATRTLKSFVWLHGTDGLTVLAGRSDKVVF